MRRVLIVLLALALTGCSTDEPAGRQVGVWCPDDDVLRETEDLTRAPQDEKRRKMTALIARAKAELRAALMPVEFTRDAILVGPKRVPYTIRSSNGDDMILDVTDGNERKELRLTMQGNDTMVTDLAMGGGKQIRLRRMY